MVESYEVIEQKEILHEAFAGLLADLDFLMEKLGIDAETSPLHPLSVLSSKLDGIWNNILSTNYATPEEMHQLRGTYEFAHNYIATMLEATNG